MFKLLGVKYKSILDIGELDIPEGKVTCITGESGSGKTTLLRLLNNLVSCDEGKIIYNGRDMTHINPVELRREVVMLPQTPVVFEGSIKDNLLIGLKFSEKPPADDTKLAEAMKMSHLDKNLSDNAEKLSGGEKQRLTLARVILLDPRVLLLDEPSSALDEGTERIVIENVVNYARTAGKTLVMVTHSKEIARAFGEYLIEISRGKVTQQGGISRE